MTPDTGNTVPLNNPNMPGAVQPGAATPTVGGVEQMLAQLLKSQAVQRQQVMLPQQLPPKQTQPNDLSGMLVNPSTIGGPKHNAKVVLAQSIGRSLTDVENRKNQEKARDIAYDVARLEAAMNNPTPENVALANEILNDPKKAKELQEALNLPGNLLGNGNKPDKTPPFIKQARQMIFGNKGKQQPPQGQPQQGAPMSESLGMPQGMQQGGVPMQPQQGGAAVPTPQAQPMPQAQPQVQPPQQPQAIPGRASQLMSQMPITTQLSPEAQVNAQAIQLGLRPTADKLVDYLSKSAKNDLDWEKTMAVLKMKGIEIDEKEQDSLRKAAVAGQKMQVALIIARSHANATLGSASIKAGAENKRTQAFEKNTETLANTKVAVTQAQTDVQVLKTKLAGQVHIATAKDTSSGQKKSAMEQIDIINSQLDQANKNLQDLNKSYKGLQDAGNSTIGGSATTDSDAQALDDITKLLSDDEN